ncbi:unnamed protein product [Ceratitis capitata]|uniref:(Mediterranean fruit fly) hypothetical protein n=1 Tax=Ceratitis capitata TaxID=7213 RepID=A0A811V2Y3_CERCA|nr:unnamed protein product [Ceratitis capitata]
MRLHWAARRAEHITLPLRIPSILPPPPPAYSDRFSMRQLCPVAFVLLRIVRCLFVGMKPPIALAVDTIIIAYSIAIEFRLGFQQQQICNVAATAAADIRVKSITNTQPPELATLIYLYG